MGEEDGIARIMGAICEELERMFALHLGLLPGTELEDVGAFRGMGRHGISSGY